MISRSPFAAFGLLNPLGESDFVSLSSSNTYAKRHKEIANGMQEIHKNQTVQLTRRTLPRAAF
jgi:hypothetical protein